MIELIQDNTFTIMIVLACLLVLMLGVLVSGFLSYIKLISQVTVYHSLSITDRVLFEALREKGVIPSTNELKITEFMVLLKVIMFFIMLICNVVAFFFIKGDF